MGIDKESDVSASLQIGPTSLGMVRIYLEAEGFELPLDFHPDEAEEIAEEIRAAAARARETGRPSGGTGSDGGGKGRRQEGRRGGSKRRAGSGSPS